jgi:hypothetical protein
LVPTRIRSSCRSFSRFFLSFATPCMHTREGGRTGEINQTERASLEHLELFKRMSFAMP